MMLSSRRDPPMVDLVRGIRVIEGEHGEDVVQVLMNDGTYLEVDLRLLQHMQLLAMQEDIF